MSVTLSLRVTSDKRRSKAKLPNSKDESLIKLIKHLRQNYQNGTSSCEFLDELEKAKDLKAQIEILKKGLIICKHQKEDGSLYNFYFHVLTEIILSLELKSPLRNGVVRIMKDINQIESIKIVLQLSEGMKRRLSAHDHKILSILHTANSVCGCFDNFTPGLDAVRICCKELLTFIVDSLTFCKKMLNAGGKSAQNTELCQCIHALVRAGLHVNSLDVSASVDIDKSQLHQLAHQLMSYDSLPLDARTNCGLLSVATSQHVWIHMLQTQLLSDDDLTSLCLFSGLIGFLSNEDLATTVETIHEKKPPVQLIFDQIINIHKRNPLEPTVTLSVARTLVALSRVMASCNNDQLLQMLPALLSYTWEHLEHVMDSVKHLAVSLLNNIIKLHSPEMDVHSSVLSAMSYLPTWGRARHTALSALLGRIPVSQLISSPSEIWCMYNHLSHQTISSHAVNTFHELLRHHYKEICNKDEWIELWIRPLLQHLDQNSSTALQQVLSKALSISPDVVQYILRFPDGQVSLGTILLCLRLSYKSGLLDTSGADASKWKGVIGYDMLRSAVDHPDDQTRLSCLSLVVEAPKTSKAFTPNELQFVVEFVFNNMHWDNPASHQRNIALLGKFVSRFNDSLQVLQRCKDDAAAQLMMEYSLCKQQLEQFSIENLFPGATYSRRVSALNLLTILRPSGSSQLQSALLACLADSYEDVKAMAVDLLTTTHGLLNNFNIPSTVMYIIDKGLEHAGGVRPPESLSAAYLLVTLSRVALSKETITAVVNKFHFCAPDTNLDDIEHISVYCLVQITMGRLAQQLEVAQDNILKAAASAPLHGLLFTIRLLLYHINLKECASEAWKQMTKRLIDLSFSCSAAVSSVVNNDSPEGHFPMDFDFDPSEMCGKIEGLVGVTSQMVLLCSWRTVKEVSLLLGYLVEESHIVYSSQERGLLDEDDIFKIGLHLTTLLAETKHRGAFEQAYVGFCKLVSRLWRLPEGKLQQLPLKWLQDTMEEISSSEVNLCATRRSAGIPFMIQALICTQMEIEGPSSVETWVNHLLDLAESAVSPPTIHTHALNILRALFRSTQLGVAVSVCVERAFMISITAFSATNWMVRNSATLLLSALMTRVFGVPRSKSQDSLSWKNKMTGRIFFQRYPKLFSFFQKELKNASQFSAMLHPSLYPVLLVLGRLYPSSLEGTDSNVQLSQYIPEIVVCSGSNVYKTRTLAARAMVALMTPPHLDTIIEQGMQDGVPANLRHGLLLQVEYYLKYSDVKICQPFLKEQAKSWMNKLTSLLRNELSCTELETLFNVFNILCDKYFALFPRNLWIKIELYSINYLKQIDEPAAIGSCLLGPIICQLLLKLAVVSKNDEQLDLLCCQMLRSDMYEIQHTVLDLLCHFCNEPSDSYNFIEFFKNIDSNIKNSCQTHISNSINVNREIVHKTLRMFNKGSKYSEDKVKILSVLGNWDKAWLIIHESSGEYSTGDILSFLLDLCRDSHDNVVTSAMCCLNKFMRTMQDFDLPYNEEDITKINSMIMDISACDTNHLFCDSLQKILVDHCNVLQQFNNASDKLRMYKTLVELSDASQWSEVINQVVESEQDSQLTATLLLALAFGEFCPSESNQSEYVGRVFTKEEVNTDYEEYILSKVSIKRFQEFCALKKNILKVRLESPLRDWLSQETGLNGESLMEFIMLARIKVLDMNSQEPCQFLNSGYQRFRLNCLKMKNIKI